MIRKKCKKMSGIGGTMADEKYFEITLNKCVCCLRETSGLLRLDTCKHANYFSKMFHYNTAIPLRWICRECHWLLMKFTAFKRQVESSIKWLNTAYIKPTTLKECRDPLFALQRTSIEISYTTNSGPLAFEEITTNDAWTKQDVEIPPAEWAEVDDTDLKSGVILMPEASTHEEVDLPLEVKKEPDDYSDCEESLPLSRLETVRDPPITSQSSDMRPNILINLLKKRPRISDIGSSPYYESFISRIGRPNTDIVKQYRGKKRHAEAEEEASTSRPKLSTVDNKYGGKFRTVSLSETDLLHERKQDSMKESYLKLPYKCEYCIVGFEHEKLYKNHMETRHTEVILGEDPKPGPSGLLPSIEHTYSEPDPLKDPLSTECDIETEETDITIKVESEDDVNDELDDNSELNDDGELNEKSPRVNYVHKTEDVWACSRKFRLKKAALNFMASLPTWTLQSNISNETKRYYRCNRNESCKAGVMLITLSKLHGRVYINIGKKHTCGDHNDKNVKYLMGAGKVSLKKPNNFSITKDIRMTINELISQNLELEQIMKRLSDIYKITSNNDKVVAFVNQRMKHRQKMKTYFQERSKVSLSLSELNTWIEQHKDVPADSDVGFVLNHYVNANENKFRLVISTKRLLENALEFDDLTLHTNLTHKMLWYEYPVFLVGTTDKDERFHLLAIAICSDQKDDDFEFIFDAIKTVFEEIFETELTPKVLVADSSEAIQNGFRRVFPSCPIRVCWNHMRATVAEEYKTYQHIGETLKDLDFVQASEDADSFSKSLKLFTNKWVKLTKIFSNWVKKNQGWYESFCPGTPSTNSSLEWASHDLKIEHNIPEKLYPKRFCSHIINIVETRSLKYKDGRIKIAHSVTITPRLWKDAYGWSLSEKNIQLISENDVEKVYLIPRGDNTHIDLKDTVTDGVRSFDKYVKIKSSFCKLYLPKEEQDWQEGRCTCEVFLKTLVCKHLFGTAIRFKYTTPPKKVVQQYEYKLKCQAAKKVE